MSEENWMESLPEDLKTSESLKRYQDVPALAKAYTELERMQSGSIRIPSQEAGEQQLKEFQQQVMEKIPGLTTIPSEDDPELSTFLRKIGVPEDLDRGYVVPEGKKGAEISQALAKELGLTVGQFTKLVEYNDQQASALETAAAERKAATEAALKEKWGLAVEEKIGIAKANVDKLPLPEAVRTAVKEGTANADTMIMVNDLLALVSDPNSAAAAADGIQPPSALAPAEVQAEIDDIMKNPDNAINNGSSKTSAEYQRLTKRLIELHEMKRKATAA